MRCKNDPARSYDGTEPSPKGRGICAHAEKTGTVSHGKDGGMWIVAADKNGTRSWKRWDTTIRMVGFDGARLTIPKAREVLKIAEGSDDDMSLPKLRTHMHAAVKAFRATYPMGYHPDGIYKAYRFLVDRLRKRGLVPASTGRRHLRPRRHT